VLSGRDLCDELITRPEKFYQIWCVVVCDLETWRMRRPWPTLGCCAKKKNLCSIGRDRNESDADIYFSVILFLFTDILI